MSEALRNVTESNIEQIAKRYEELLGTEVQSGDPYTKYKKRAYNTLLQEFELPRLGVAQSSQDPDVSANAKQILTHIARAARRHRTRIKAAFKPRPAPAKRTNHTAPALATAPPTAPELEAPEYNIDGDTGHKSLRPKEAYVRWFGEHNDLTIDFDFLGLVTGYSAQTWRAHLLTTSFKGGLANDDGWNFSHQSVADSSLKKTRAVVVTCNSRPIDQQIATAIADAKDALSSLPAELREKAMSALLDTL